LRKELGEISPELARARAETVRAQRQLDLERAQRWPNLALKAAMNEDPDMRASQVGVVLTIPLWDRRSGPVGEAAAQLSRARNELAAQEFSLAQALEVAFQQYEIAQTQVTALESGILRQAESALRVAEAAYRFGERGFLEVLDAQRVYRAARAELIAARYELASAWVEIERLRASPGGKTE
jgi:outer membrane protein, heavy metal efflux system